MKEPGDEEVHSGAGKAGHLGHALTLRVHRISAAARTAVESAGGSIELLGSQPAPEGATPVGKRAQRKADAIVARAELLSRPATPAEPVAKPEGKKRAGGAAVTSEAKPAKGGGERGGKRKTAREDGAAAPETVQDAPQENEAETEDRE